MSATHPADAPERDTVAPSQHLAEMRSALVALVRYADRAGPEADVPTCPGWTVRDLVAHQGMVHRWAAASLTGADVDPDAVEVEGRVATDPVEWLRDGAIALAQALHEAPAGVLAPVFLADAPESRAFWARRQCHETTVHAVDALAAALGRRPRAAETWIDPDLALDGIDELLTGFLPRPRSRLRSDDPTAVLVLPTDAGERSWLVRVGRAPALVTRRPGRSADPLPGEPPADVLLRGTAVELFLALWNRGDEVVPAGPDGDVDVWDLWAADPVRW